MLWDRGELQAAGAMTATLLLIVFLMFFIFDDDEEEFVLPWPSVIDACLADSDRALHMCISELVEQHRPPND